MVRKILMSALTAVVVGSSLGAVPARAVQGEVGDRSTAIRKKRVCFSYTPCAYLFAAAMMLVPMPAHAVDGFNLPGFDYANFTASSEFVCRNTCGGESRCQAWT